MDQTIDKMVYRGRVSDFARRVQENGNKTTTGGVIIASDGTAYRKEGNRLVQVYDKKMTKIIARTIMPSLNELGLVPDASAKSVNGVATTEVVAEI
ncbi:MAG: hypothetical protein E7356_04680 [Clostridiales bacterium]|nr:hypothetical protein [Clostridiales bacterium]